MSYWEGKEIIRGERFDSVCDTLHEVIRVVDAAQREKLPGFSDAPKLRTLFVEVCAGRDYMTVGEEAMVVGALGNWEREIKENAEREAQEANERNDFLQQLTKEIAS